MHELLGTTHPGQVEDVACFKAWMGLITLEALQSHAWTAAFEQTALRFADRTERAAANASLAKWGNGLTEGATCGLGKQHRFTRNALGWTPTREGEAMLLEVGDRDDADGLTPDELASVLGNPASGVTPYNAQQLAEAEATSWGKEWLVEGQPPQMTWPDDIGEPPSQRTVDVIRWAAATFPAGTGLGWDALHSRALCRLSDETLLRLAAILHACERLGRWPSSLDGDNRPPAQKWEFRPIGLMPLLLRVWMRSRRYIAQQWERANDRPYLYAGAAKGAEVAAWKQAVRAELAVRGGGPPMPKSSSTSPRRLSGCRMTSCSAKPGG